MTDRPEPDATDDEPLSLSSDSLDSVFSWLEPAQLFCSCTPVCKEWHAAATALHRRHAAAVKRFGPWASEGPVAAWLDQQESAPQAILGGSLTVLSAGSNAPRAGDRRSM